MYFSIATSRFQIEMMKHLTDEVLDESRTTGEFTNAQEQFLFFNCSLLRKLISENFNKVTVTSTELVKTNKSLLTSIEALSKVTAGMGVIHVVGKIEMARTGSSSDSLASRLKEMEELTEVFKKTLKSLEQECSTGLAICNELSGHNQVINNDLRKIDQLIAV